VVPTQPTQATIRKQQRISQDLCNRFVARVQSNPSVSIADTARAFSLATSTAYGIPRRFEITGSTELLKRGGAKNHKMTQSAYEALDAWVDERPDLTLAQLSAKLFETFHISVSNQSVSNALTKIGFTVKLLRTIPMSRNTPSTLQARKDFAQRFLAEAPDDSRNIVWIDEAGFNLHLRRKFGRARIGQRASIELPNSQGRNISVCAAMSCDGFLHERLRPGAYDAVSFCEFLIELFAILAAANRSQCWLILDNV
jgi:transposase